jgi:xylulokinase
VDFGFGNRIWYDTLKLAATPTLAATPQSVNSALEEAWMRYQSLYPRLKKK